MGGEYPVDKVMLHLSQNSCGPTVSGSLGRQRPPIGRRVAFRALDRMVGALGIFNAKLAAVVVAERELVDITLKKLIAAVLVDTNPCRA